MIGRSALVGEHKGPPCTTRTWWTLLLPCTPSSNYAPIAPYTTVIKPVVMVVVVVAGEAEVMVDTLARA